MNVPPGYQEDSF